VLAYGSMGGEGQPQTQAAVFARYACFGLSVEAAVDLPRWRLGRAWGETETTLKIEPRFDGALIDKLAARGHQIEVLDQPYSPQTGQAGLIVRTPNGRIEGVHDPRADGGAAGI
jgi:oxamate amidohydrolase